MLSLTKTVDFLRNSIPPDKRIKVLLYGNFDSRLYRTKILVKYLQDQQYEVSQVIPSFYRQLKYVAAIKSLPPLLHFIELFFKAATTDVIYMPPMNTTRIESAVWVAKFFNKKLIVETYVSLYDTFVKDRQEVPKGSKAAQAMREKDILALTKPDYIIHTSAHELSYWEQLLGIELDRKKIAIAPLFNFIPPAWKRDFCQNGVLRICWWGTFIPLHGLNNILQAMKILQASQLQFTCHLFGIDNKFFSEYAEKIQLAQLGDRVFLRKDLSFAEGTLTNYLTDNCDLALGIFGNTEKARHAVPNKLIEALSMGIPTLTMNSPALKEFFQPETDLWVCEPSPESIAESILKIARSEAYQVNWKQTRQKVLNTFSMSHYQEVVDNVLTIVTEDIPANSQQVQQF